MKFQSLQVKAPDNLTKAVKEFQAQLPVATLYKPEGGVEDRPHVTILYGLQEQSAPIIQEILKEWGDLEVMLGDTKAFFAEETGNPYDVLYTEVVGRQLHLLRFAVESRLPYKSTWPNFTPHMTIAFMNPGTANAYVGRRDLRDWVFTTKEVEFSDIDRDLTKIKLAEEREIDGQIYERVPDSVRPLSGSIAVAIGYKVRDDIGWVPKGKLKGLLDLDRQIKREEQ